MLQVTFIQNIRTHINVIFVNKQICKLVPLYLPKIRKKSTFLQMKLYFIQNYQCK